MGGFAGPLQLLDNLGRLLCQRSRGRSRRLRRQALDRGLGDLHGGNDGVDRIAVHVEPGAVGDEGNVLGEIQDGRDDGQAAEEEEESVCSGRSSSANRIVGLFFPSP